MKLLRYGLMEIWQYGGMGIRMYFKVIRYKGRFECLKVESYEGLNV